MRLSRERETMERGREEVDVAGRSRRLPRLDLVLPRLARPVPLMLVELVLLAAAECRKMHMDEWLPANTLLIRCE